MLDINTHYADKDIEKVELFFETFGRKAEQAMAKSLKRAAGSVKTNSGKAVGRHYNIKATPVKKAATIKFNKAQASAAVGFESMRMPLVNFGARPLKKGRPRAKLTVKVKNTRKTVRGAFIATMASGHTGVFQRTGAFGRNENDDLERIEELTTVSIPQMFGNMKLQEWVTDHALESFNRNLNHEIDWILQQKGL